MAIPIKPLTDSQIKNAKSKDKAYKLAVGIDSSAKRKADEREQLLQSNNTFAAIGEEYMSRKTHIAPSTTKNNYRQLKRLNTHLGNMPITDVKPIDVLEACRSAEAQGIIG